MPSDAEDRTARLGFHAAHVARIPAATRVVLIYPPVHDHYLQTMAVNVGECKARTAALLASRADLVTLDYMRPTALTRDDGNFWDAVHTTAVVARRIEDDVVAVLGGAPPRSPEVAVIPRWR